LPKLSILIELANIAPESNRPLPVVLGAEIGDGTALPFHRIESDGCAIP